MFKQHLGLIISLILLLAGLATATVLVTQPQFFQKQAGVTCAGGETAYCKWDSVPNADSYQVKLTEKKQDGATITIFDGVKNSNYICFNPISGSEYTCETYPISSVCTNYGSAMKGMTSLTCQIPPTPTLTPTAKPNLTIGIQDFSPSQPIAGNDVSFRIKVQESAGVAVSNRFWYKVELTKIIGMNPQIIERYERYIGPLGANGARINPFDSSVLSKLGNIQQGHYIVSAYADAALNTSNSNLVDEANETDNEAHFDFYVGAAPTLTPTPTPTNTPTPTSTPAPTTGTISGNITLTSTNNVTHNIRVYAHDPYSTSGGPIESQSIPVQQGTLVYPYALSNSIRDGVDYVVAAQVGVSGSKVMNSYKDCDRTADRINPDRWLPTDCLVTAPAAQNFTITIPAEEPPAETGTISGTVTANFSGNAIQRISLNFEKKSLDGTWSDVDTKYFDNPTSGQDYTHDFTNLDVNSTYRIFSHAFDKIVGGVSVGNHIITSCSGSALGSTCELQPPGAARITITIPAVPVCSGITYTLTPSSPLPNTEVIVDISRSGASSCSGNWNHVGLLLDGVEQGIALCDHNGNNCGNMYHSTINSGSAGEHTLQFTVNRDSCLCNEMRFTTEAGVPPPPPAGAPSADLDGSGSVDVEDASVVMSAWGSASGDSNFNSAADLDGDGAITALDVSILMSQFGEEIKTAGETPALEPTVVATAVSPTLQPTPTPTAGKSLIQTLIDFVLGLFR